MDNQNFEQQPQQPVQQPMYQPQPMYVTPVVPGKNLAIASLVLGI